MDDVVDLEEEKINTILEKIDNDPELEDIKVVERNLWIKIKEKLLQGRRTGLSGIGLADTLAMLNISYSDGVDMAESIYKNLAIYAYGSSIVMAQERGAFPIWDYNKEKLNPFIQRFFEYHADRPWKEFLPIAQFYVKYGRRNIALLTIPPSGTIK